MGGTPFEGMSHEAMLAWLDQANSGTVQGAADRLAAAAKEIRKIADDLKVRPQWVDWKGAGADAFRTWSADLANATLRLGDFSEGSSTWLGHASDAIASAQAAIPRDKPGAEGNLAAAQKAHNDPDAAAISRKSTAELAALEADKEKVRQEAVAQMRKLGQAYQQSATQMNGLERPKFPPPPQSIAPEVDGASDRGGSSVHYKGVADSASQSGRTGWGHSEQTHAVSGSPNPGHYSAPASPVQPSLGNAHQPARMDVDSVPTLLPTAPPPSSTGSGPGPGSGHGGEASTVHMPPPVFDGGLRVPPGPLGTGRAAAVEGPLARTGQVSSGRSSVRMPSDSPGIVGGRPVPAGPDRPKGSVPIPRGNVVGAEDAGSHGAARPAVGAGPAGQAAGRPGAMPGRGALTPRSGVSGGSAQQPGRTASPRPVSGAAEERGGISGGRPVAGNPGSGAHSRKRRPQRETGGGGRGYLVEDDETWLRDDSRVVPPVID